MATYSQEMLGFLPEDVDVVPARVGAAHAADTDLEPSEFSDGFGEDAMAEMSGAPLPAPRKRARAADDGTRPKRARRPAAKKAPAAEAPAEPAPPVEAPASEPEPAAEPAPPAKKRSRAPAPRRPAPAADAPAADAPVPAPAAAHLQTLVQVLDHMQKQQGGSRAEVDRSVTQLTALLAQATVFAQTIAPWMSRLLGAPHP